MSGGKTIDKKRKTSKKTGGAKKKAIRISDKSVRPKTRKQSISKKVISRRAPKRINLKTKTTVNPRIKKKTLKQATKKRGVKGPEKDSKNKKLKKKVRSSYKKKKLDLLSDIPRGRIIAQKTERDKKFLMWVLVSFFMVLITVFWFYSSRESIKKTQFDWERSESAKDWNKMSDELNESIQEMKTNLKSLKSFASSSEEQSLETSTTTSIFQNRASTTKEIDKKLIQNLKHSLEVKSGASQPTEKDYFFILRGDDLKLMLAGLEKIKIGDNLERIKAVLGQADFEETLRDKRGGFVSKVLTYYIKILNKDSVNEKYDRYVGLDFDDNDILVKINKILD